MASTVLEQTRQYHEDMERLERLIVKDFTNEPTTHKEKLMQGHRVRQLLGTLQDRAQKLVRELGKLSFYGCNTMCCSPRTSRYNKPNFYRAPPMRLAAAG
jgi:hypothetical protein